MADPAIGRDLVKIVVGYNAGPGNLRRWLDEAGHGGDPLLFIESIPSGQARAYAERVLSSFWIYRMRLGQPTPSLDAVASGGWPQYMSMDGTQTQVADHGAYR
jgi:soluble lytic murein transglycosylase-like protein